VPLLIIVEPMIENTRNDIEKMFFLTKTEQIVISSMDEVFNCANQCLYDPHNPELAFDRFGRNYLDRQFVQLCLVVHIYYMDRAWSR